MAKSESSNLIISLVEELRSLDPEFRVFGSEKKGSGWGHGYQFNPVIEERLLGSLEHKYGVQLPPDYREFLTQVGDGGSGPYYGIKTLAEAAQYTSPSQPFPWATEFKFEKDADFERWEDLPGVIVISEQGCGYTDFLVVNGTAYGQVWGDYSGPNGSLLPHHYNFTDWYMEWVTHCINTIKREPLLNKIRVGMTKDEVRSILGWDMQQWEGGAAFPDSPSYYIGFTNTNASFLMSEDDRVLKINKMDQV